MVNLRRLMLLALVVVSSAGIEASDPAGAAQCASPTSDHVAVVVDYGSALTTSGLSRFCATVAPRASGLEALRAAVGSIGTDASGKVCQIGPVPADFDRSNCSEPRNGMLSYWAYFHGRSNGWTYSGVGAAGSRAQPDVVEGWHYVTMPVAQQTSAPPPRNFPDGASYVWQSTCPAAAPAPTTPSRPGGAAARPAPTSPAAPDTGRVEGPGSAASTPSGSTSPGSTSPSTTAGSGRSSTTRAAGTGLRSSGTAPVLSPDEVRAAVAADRSRSRPVGAIVAGSAAIAAVSLGLVVATRRSRRRRLLDDAPS